MFGIAKCRREILKPHSDTAIVTCPNSFIELGMLKSDGRLRIVGCGEHISLDGYGGAGASDVVIDPNCEESNIGSATVEKGDARVYELKEFCRRDNYSCMKKISPRIDVIGDLNAQ